MIDTICLSGGGIKGFSFIGVLEYLEKNNNININLINNFVGTSIGAIISFLLSIKYDIIELKEFLLNFNFKILINDYDNNIENLLINFGLDDGNKIIFILQSFLKNKYNLTDITFKEHYELTKNNLIIIGTNYTKSSEEMFNYKNTPNMSIITAIRISISVPLIFTPVLYNDNYYVDGALVNNFPINYCNLKNTIGININFTNNYNKIDNIAIYIKNCLGILIKNNNKSLNIINMEFDSENDITNLIDFNINNENKINLINLGNKIAKKYIDNISNNICQSIIEEIIFKI
jgi:predicted acylesterase/phospholipase RssA